MIVSAKEVDQSIRFVSRILEMMRVHSEEHNIEFIYRGFRGLLNEFENKINILSSKCGEAIEKNSVEGWNHINKKVLSKNLFC